MVTDGPSRSPEQVDVAVVGAGITGLILCRELAERGRSVVALEAAARPGGVIESRRSGGRVLELGPQRTRLTGPVSELTDDLGLRDELVTAPRDLPLYVLRDGRLRRAPLGPAALAGTGLLSLAGKLRLLAEPFASPPREDESAAAYFIRGFGEEAYRHVLGPLFGGIYASDPARMPARYSLIPLWRALGAPRSLVLAGARRALSGEDRPPACTYRGGLSTLTDALHERCGHRVRLRTRVSRVASRGRCFLVLPEEGRAVRAPHVVLTVRAGEASRLLEEAAPAARALSRLRYNPLAVVHLASSLERSGYGYQVSLDEEGFATRGVTWNASLFGREGLFTAYLGGMGREEDVDRADGWLAERAAREFEAATGARARPLSVHRTRIPAHDESWSALDAARRALPRGIHLCANYESPAGIPSRIRRAREVAADLDRALAGDRPDRRGAPSADGAASGPGRDAEFDGDDGTEHPRGGGR